MKLPWQIMTGADWLLVLALFGLSLGGVVWLVNAPTGTRVVATSGDQTCFVGRLDQNQSVDIEGPLGYTRLVIDDQGAHISRSPCPRKLCMTMGPARHGGDLMACIPNRIVVRIEPSDAREEPYDLLSR